MGVDGVRDVAQAAPEALLIATHARINRADLRKFAEAEGLMSRLFLLEDGEELECL